MITRFDAQDRGKPVVDDRGHSLGRVGLVSDGVAYVVPAGTATGEGSGHSVPGSDGKRTVSREVLDRISTDAIVLGGHDGQRPAVLAVLVWMTRTAGSDKQASDRRPSGTG